ncbi:hypothetical protein FOL47_003033 [Perkinsus chesapeaki]|uniref:Uncharacterized protein n=1 Tax=Perkinsus chesapeaki TaxID=330153 RepID=A0A7J6MB82_PERCH|nr:hypothetical protein FOL47_003033 [Perkinsus chesapeaki]
MVGATDTEANIALGPPALGSYTVTGDFPFVPIKEIHILAKNRLLLTTILDEYWTDFTMTPDDMAILPKWTAQQIQKLMSKFSEYINRATLVGLDRATEGHAIAIRYTNGKEVYYSHSSSSP